MDWITLNEFREKHIPIDDQIYLIGNDQFFGDHHFCVSELPQQPGIVKKILSKIYNFDFAPKLKIPKKSGILFLGYADRSYDQLVHLGRLFEGLRKKSPSEFVILIGKGDYEINQTTVPEIPENVLQIFGNNLNVSNPRLSYFPMGRDFRSVAYFSQDFKSDVKTSLCYCNYSISTHPHRKLVYDHIRDKSFIEFDHMGEFLNYSISRREFYEKLAAAKFSICPRGNGIDTFRLWDSLYVGTIPIVVKEAVFHDYLRDLPILFLDSIEDFQNLNPEFLNNTYEQMISTKYNFKKLHLSYWKNKVLSYL